MPHLFASVASHSRLIAFGLPGGWEWIVLLVLGLLIFGRRLPDVGRSLGRGIVEFKKGIKGIEEEIDAESSKPLPPPARREELSSQTGARSEARETRKEPVGVDSNQGDE
jgi:sec-independent protein translocase protein TatA